MFYENWNIVFNEPFNYFDNIEDLNYSEHFHRIYEFVVVREGEIIFNMNKTKYVLGVGDAILIMPNQFHSVHTPEHSKILMLRFAPKLVEMFYTAYNGKIPETNKFRMPSALLPSFSEPQNVYQQKARIYEICGEFCAQVTRWHDSQKDGDVLYKMLMYIEHNFLNDFSLKDVAADLKYDYTYLSKLFLRCTGMTFLQFLNELRVDHACRLLADSERSITEIARDSGYNSLCSFNRNFLKIVGTTPSEYRTMRK